MGHPMVKASLEIPLAPLQIQSIQKDSLVILHQDVHDGYGQH